ncbi:hypothetical protein ACLBR5_19980 [Escherichia coli]
MGGRYFRVGRRLDAVTTAMASAAPALGAMAVVAGPMGYDLLANDGRAGKALSEMGSK